MVREKDRAWFSHLYDIWPGNGAGLFLQPRARLRNNLYCVEWDIKLYFSYTIPYWSPEMT